MPIGNLDEIGNARSELYEKLEKGEITENRALAQERVLRGQMELKATIPLRMLSIVTKSRHTGIQAYGELLLKKIITFTTGEKPPELEAPKE